MASSPWVSYLVMAFSTKNLVYSIGADLDGMEAKWYKYSYRKRVDSYTFHMAWGVVVQGKCQG